MEERKSFYEAVIEDYKRPQKIWGGAHLYVELGLYYEQVKRYLDVFEGSRVRVFLYDGLESNTSRLVEDVCNFLNVPFGDGRFFDAAKKYNTCFTPTNPFHQWLLGTPESRYLAALPVPRQVSSTIMRLFSNKQPKPPLDPRAREFLRSVYHDDILKLQELIGRDLSGWLV